MIKCLSVVKLQLHYCIFGLSLSMSLLIDNQIKEERQCPRSLNTKKGEYKKNARRLVFARSKCVFYAKNCSLKARSRRARIGHRASFCMCRHHDYMKTIIIPSNNEELEVEVGTQEHGNWDS